MITKKEYTRIAERAIMVCTPKRKQIESALARDMHVNEE